MTIYFIAAIITLTCFLSTLAIFTVNRTIERKAETLFAYGDDLCRRLDMLLEVVEEHVPDIARNQDAIRERLDDIHAFCLLVEKYQLPDKESRVLLDEIAMDQEIDRAHESAAKKS